MMPRDGNSGTERWPADPGDLEALQVELAEQDPEPWRPSDPLRVGGCFVCFARGVPGPGATGDRGWAAAVVLRGRRQLGESVAAGAAGFPYVPGLLAAREGPLLAAVIAALEVRPDVVLINGTGRDHPRRAGLALHLGWALDVPTVGVTHRPLVATGEAPGAGRGARSPLRLDDEQVGWWVRTRRGARPVAVSPGWRTDLTTCLVALEAADIRVRTPEPIRRARRLARVGRSRNEGDRTVTDSER